MTQRIEVTHKPTLTDAAGDKLTKRLWRDLALNVDHVRVVDIYLIDKDLDDAQLTRAKDELFCDPITQDSSFEPILTGNFDVAIEVGFLPGVTDNAGRTSAEGLSDLLGVSFEKGEAVYTAKRYLVSGAVGEEEAARIAAYLSNPLINRTAVAKRKDALAHPGFGLCAPRVTLLANTRVDTVDLECDEAELVALGKEGIKEVLPSGIERRRGPLALDLPSLHVIRDYFRKEGRAPTDVELECLAQTWSEHCKHTIFAAKIDQVNGLFKSVIQAATKAVRAKKGAKDDCVSVFSDNSGVLRFVDGFDICYKVETHNSPSALDPYGGAITGIVGVNRDPLGTGLGAKLVTNMYGFCFADPFFAGELPYRQKGKVNPILHPRVIFEGVREGVEHGGNKSGIPTSWGFLYFDRGYMGKPLVFVGTLGLMPSTLNGVSSSLKAARPGDRIVMAGGRVGADGIHGATFSSESLHAGSPSGAVQIGDPITQKKLGDAQHEARDLGLYSSVTDCGAGGISCSICEMARECGGCEVELDRVPLKYQGLAPNEIWISESQERMTYAVPPENVERFLALYKKRGVEATVVGRFTDSGRARVTYAGATVMDIDLGFLHDGLPQKQLGSKAPSPLPPEPALAPAADLGAELTAMMARLNLCSKEYIVRQYDHEVQGGSVIKPLVGVGSDIHSDASVTRPLLSSQAGVALSSALFPSYGLADPYQMAACAIDQAFRNVVAVGANPERVALLDNFCWCSSYDPTRLWQLKEAARACYDLALAYEAPFISGKDSMFNDFKGFTGRDEPQNISVLPTLLVSSVGILEDARAAQSLDFKATGDALYVLGETREELGGSEYARLRNDREGTTRFGGTVPKVTPEATAALCRSLHRAITQGLAASVAPLGLGGVGFALAKGALAGGLGLDADLATLGRLSPEALLFSETPGRFLVSVAPQNVPAFEALFKGQVVAKLGETTAEPVLTLRNGATVSARVDLAGLLDTYKKTLNW